MADIAKRVAEACAAAGISQRALARQTRLSQPTLSRITSGARAATLPELILIAEHTGSSIAWLSGASTVEDRAEFAARATGTTSMKTMRAELLNFLELNAYLDDQAV